ncbi:uncharacterized protein LOC113663663 isoform X2 [Tachysurus fulvidraco]|uniref:uncharacterized protein LOC113663663 isoform X2 n=1 Tax=Tachysurus fulvidraco TaxID=1234273 RepID=UPI001FEEF1E9|nr:uncharacterized protein LOC113663663 isoform X2 [Tachysurus fulvidraco]
MPLMFVNMSQGERLAYPLYVIDALLQRCEDKNIHLRVVYDIACVVASHLQGRAYHTTSPWPYQHFMFMDTNCPARFARVTKEMTPSHRLDLLTDALLHYGWSKSTDLEVQLLQRLDKAEKISILAQEDISSVIREAPVLVSEGDMERWKKREMELAQQKQKPINTVCRWKRDYIIRLIQFYKFKIEDSLQNMEKKHRIRRRWQESDSDFQSTLKDVERELRAPTDLQG